MKRSILLVAVLIFDRRMWLGDGAGCGTCVEGRREGR